MSPNQRPPSQDLETLDKSTKCSASGHHGRAPIPVSDFEQALTIRPMNPILNISGTELERRSWHHFRCHTAPILAGYFDFDFWNRILLQMSHSEPILRHAMIAVSVVHEWAAKVGNLPIDAMEWQKERDHRFALEHYNSAISLLVSRSKPTGPPLDITLMVCILFVCIEFLQHNKENAISHVKNGLSILKSLESKELGFFMPPIASAPGSRGIDKRIIQMFLRLATQCKFLGLEHKFPTLRIQSAERSPVLGPPTFTSLMAAREAMDHLMEESLRFLLYVEPFRDCALPDVGLTVAQSNLLKELDWWLFGFESFVQTSEQTMASHDLEATKMLRIHHRISKIWLSTCLSLETAHDAYLSDFRAVVALAEPMVKTSMDYKTFSFEMGADPPIYFVALKCRHPVLRRQAIRLLNSRHRQEAHWHSRQMASIGEYELYEANSLFLVGLGFETLEA